MIAIGLPASLAVAYLFFLAVSAISWATLGGLRLGFVGAAARGSAGFG